MTLQLWITALSGFAGIVSLAIAVFHERRMQAHRHNGVSYSGNRQALKVPSV